MEQAHVYCTSSIFMTPDHATPDCRRYTLTVATKLGPPRQSRGKMPQKPFKDTQRDVPSVRGMFVDEAKR